jgi:hypothetical protein
MRTLIAFLLAPAAPAAAASIVSLALGGNVSDAGFYLFLCLFYGYPAAAILGVPAYLYCRRRGYLGVWQIALAGAVVGAAVPILLSTFVLVAALFAPANGPDGAISAMLVLFSPIGFVVGAFSGLAFWWVAFGGSATLVAK